MYVNSQICVRCANAVSEPFGPTHDIKQGFVLSPISFTLCLDDLCKYVDIVRFTDDMKLLSPRLLCLQECSIYVKLFLPVLVLLLMQRRLCIKFHHGRHVNEITQYTIFLGNDKLKWYSQVKHIGYT